MKKYMFAMVLLIVSLTGLIALAETQPVPAKTTATTEAIEIESTTEHYDTCFYGSIRVESGDTLSTMCEEFYTSDNYNNRAHWDSLSDYQKEVQQINGIKNPDLIKYGNFIIFPYYH